MGILSWFYKKERRRFYDLDETVLSLEEEFYILLCLLVGREGINVMKSYTSPSGASYTDRFFVFFTFKEYGHLTTLPAKYFNYVRCDEVPMIIIPPHVTLDLRSMLWDYFLES